MIEVALSGQQIEFEWTLDSRSISDWSFNKKHPFMLAVRNFL
mgnify:CR=1 FL=1